jgi:hypothetical protein
VFARTRRPTPDNMRNVLTIQADTWYRRRSPPSLTSRPASPAARPTCRRCAASNAMLGHPRAGLRAQRRALRNGDREPRRRAPRRLRGRPGAPDARGEAQTKPVAGTNRGAHDGALPNRASSILTEARDEFFSTAASFTWMNPHLDLTPMWDGEPGANARAANPSWRRCGEFLEAGTASTPVPLRLVPS